MNLDKEFCASHCTNYECDRIISYSILMAAEKRQVPVRLFDFSSVCLEFEYDEDKKYLEAA